MLKTSIKGVRGIYNFYHDPGHGWLEVPEREVDILNIKGELSPYSYVDSGIFYLEEDVDMAVFIGAWEKYTGLEFERERVKSIYQNTTPIRDYNHHYNPTYDSKSAINKYILNK